MADVRISTQLSVFLVNKPGVLAQVTGTLAKEKVNIIALTLVDAQEHGVLRIVPEDPAAARSAVTKLNLPLTETEVLCLDLSNHPGALAEVASLLAKNHININYAYCTSGAPGGRTTGIFKVADQNKAIRLLKTAPSKHKEPSLHKPGPRQ